MSTPLPVVFMFSGQGSQYYRMGQELYDENPVFRAALRRHDDVVAQALGESVLARIFDPAKRRSEPFTDTRFSHPAIVMIELALAQTLTEAGVTPDYLLGVSLGEYAAAVVAGCIEPAECLRLLVDQVRALRAGPRGGMLAVLDQPDVLDRVPELRVCEIAARNYPGHFVVSASLEVLDAAEAALRAADVPHQRVAVEYPYHSSLMDSVAAAAQRAMAATTMGAPRIPLVSCVDGELVERVTPEHLWQAARRPIEFQTAITAMRRRGDFHYLDLGPAGTLNNFVKGNLPPGSRSRSAALLSPFGHDPDLLTRLAREGTRPKPPRPKPPRKASGMKVYGFPGQGSQQRGMGRDLFGRFPAETALADRVLGTSIEELCVADPERKLGRTEFTQPAIYVVSALSYLDRRATDPRPPDYVVGHSIGEYVALFAAGVLDFEDGLRLVQRRGQLMAQAGGGGMAAIVGADEQTVTRTLTEAGLDGLDLANQNAPDQFVLSGPVEELDRACTVFQESGARAVRLNVSAPFHSRYMRDAAAEFGRFLDGFTLRPPTIPVLANVTALPYSGEDLKSTLAAQIAAPVRWTDMVRRLMGLGDFEFIELGPGQVLTKLVRKIRENAQPLDMPVPAMVAAEPVRTAAEPARPTAESLGAASFRERYGLRYAYLLGGMYRGISGPELLGAAAKGGLLGFLGTGGLELDEVAGQLRGLVGDLGLGGAFGVNLLYRHGAPEAESALVDLLLQHGVELVEASGFPEITPALVRFRLNGGRIIAKVSRTDVAAQFLAPPPQRLVERLLAAGEVTEEAARAASGRPMADDLCVEAVGGWLDGTADLLTLLPSVIRLRDAAALSGPRVHVGCAGGIGTPEAAAAAFMLGAEFILTGSVNQCSVEAATSSAVKDMLAQAQEYDVDAGPWGEQLELGVRARYLKRGLFFPARANRLHELSRQYHTLAELDDATRSRVVEQYLGGELPATTDLAAVLRGYVERCHRLALTGDERSKVDFLIHCGPAMGAFNQVVAGTRLEDWRARTVEAIATLLMEDAAAASAQLKNA